MDWKMLLGILIGLVSGIVANLLTPFAAPLWSTLVTLQRHGYHANIRQQIKVHQNQIGELTRRHAGSNRDLFLYLLKWLLTIFATFTLAVACTFVAMTSSEVNDLARRRLLFASLACLIGTIVLTIFLLAECRNLTETGVRKRIAKLESDIVKLTRKLPSEIQSP